MLHRFWGKTFERNSRVSPLQLFSTTYTGGQPTLEIHIYVCV